MKLYFEFLSIHIKKAMQYKASFLLSALAQLFVPLTCFWGVQFMFMQFNQVDGFTYTEVSLCYAIVLLSFSLAELFFRGFDTFNRMIGNGEFDRVLVRPRNEVFLVLCSRLDLERFGKGIMAIFLLIWALQNCPIDWCAARVMTLIFMILGGIVLFAGVYLIFAGLCFFTLEGLEFINILTDGMREHGRYPLSIYGKGVLTFCTYIVPYALVQYYPLMYLIGRHNDARAMLLPVIACVFIIPCYLFWKFGVRRYRSTGS